MNELQVYIAGPYGNANTPYEVVAKNILIAETAAINLANSKIVFFCPHKHTAFFERRTRGVPNDYWMKICLHFLKSCNAILLLPGYEKSVGSLQELAYAQMAGYQIFHNVGEIISYYKEQA